jgi:hypothetical protein
LLPLLLAHPLLSGMISSRIIETGKPEKQLRQSIQEYGRDISVYLPSSDASDFLHLSFPPQRQHPILFT